MATSDNQPKAAPDKSAAEYQKAGQEGADKAAVSKATSSTRRSETTARTASRDSVRTQRGNTDKDGNVGLADQLRESHDARVTVPGADNVDARLDNRRGADRPPLEEWPAKPQQIDGPDVMTQAEHTRRTLQDRDDAAGDRKGMFSPGPHGLSDETLREGGPAGETQTLYGTESLTEAEVAVGEPKADG